MSYKIVTISAKVALSISLLSIVSACSEKIKEVEPVTLLCDVTVEQYPSDENGNIPQSVSAENIGRSTFKITIDGEKSKYRIFDASENIRDYSPFIDPLKNILLSNAGLRMKGVMSNSDVRDLVSYGDKEVVLDYWRNVGPNFAQLAWIDRENGTFHGWSGAYSEEVRKQIDADRKEPVDDKVWGRYDIRSSLSTTRTLTATGQCKKVETVVNTRGTF